MKKFVAVAIVLCLIIAGVAGFAMKDKFTEKDELNTQGPDGVETPAAEAQNDVPKVQAIDFEALYKTRDPKEVVGKINGKDLLWEEYFYNVFSQAKQMEDYLNTMAAYGMVQNWESPADETGKTNYADMAVKSAEQNLLQFGAIKGYAEKNNVVLGPEQLEIMKQQRQNDIKLFCGEEGTDEEFTEYLKSIYLTPEMYENMSRINHLFQQNFIQVYGENGEKLSDEKAVNFLNENNYIYANHILLSTVDEQTGEDIDQEAMSEKEAQAKEIAAELKEIKDNGQLIKRFGELKDEFCEDPGKESFRDGMTFTPGTMVQEFEDAVLKLENYQVSEPVKSQFGYHVIIRLPLNPDSIIGYTQMGTPVTVRGNVANIEYQKSVQEYMNNLTLEYSEGFESPNLLDYLK